MTCIKNVTLVLVCAFCLFAIPASAANITIDTVLVGNAGNANDPLTGNLYGSVSYDYRIGKYEVTNAQYAAFLNEKAKSDPLALYNTYMGSNARGGITQSGADGSYTYSTKTNMADKPVNFVSWYDAIRFTNWLHNGQGSGDTETGAYTILGGNATPSNGLSITRNPGAKWWLPSEDEWYKAAYHQPAALGGDVDDYWLYPATSNSVPTVATANSVGDISNAGANVVNYNNGAIWNSTVGNVTTVGSAGSLSESFYGTADQGGNVAEWNEAAVGNVRVFRGGWHGFDFGAAFVSSGGRFDLFVPTFEDAALGFRVATLVPEPSSYALTLSALVGLAFFARRSGRTLRNCPRRFALVFILFAFGTPQSATAANITIDTVPVGNPGNPNDPLSGNNYGGVNYEYRIGKYEVTNAQYAAFLNEKAKSDPLNLFDANMSSSPLGGITRSSSPGSYTYSTKPNMADKPVNYVTWYDTIRFTNWLHNGQGSGDTESGAYTLLGGTPTPSNGLSVTRNAGAKWWLPSESEWYKAAYHQPASQGGDSDNYWLYPTSANTVPTLATANSMGDISNPGANIANYDFGASWNSQTGNVTTVGSAGPLSENFYGTSDQGGNVSEWNEALIVSGPFTFRGARGGGLNSGSTLLQSSIRSSSSPTSASSSIGFRVATLVPEPSTWAMAFCALAGLGLMTRRRR